MPSLFMRLSHATACRLGPQPPSFATLPGSACTAYIACTAAAALYNTLLTAPRCPCCRTRLGARQAVPHHPLGRLAQQVGARGARGGGGRHRGRRRRRLRAAQHVQPNCLAGVDHWLGRLHVKREVAQASTFAVRPPVAQLVGSGAAIALVLLCVWVSRGPCLHSGVRKLQKLGRFLLGDLPRYAYAPSCLVHTRMHVLTQMSTSHRGQGGALQTKEL